MKKRSAKVSIIATVALYFISYLFLTLNGHYAATATGVVGGLPDGTFIIGPKFGYHWFLPSDYELTMRGDLSAVGILYAPLLYLDREFWHTTDRAETLEYPVKGYFDFDTMEYRDVN